MATGLQRKPSRYDLTLADGDLAVVGMTTGEVVPVSKANDKWRIASKRKANYLYFTQEQVEKAILGEKLEAIPKSKLDRRYDVEVYMFQNCYHTRNGMTRYRELAKHFMWAYSSGMLKNFIRLMNFQTTRHVKELSWTFYGRFGGFFKSL